MNRLEAALADFSAVVRLDPQFVPAYINRGAIFIAQGELGKANADYNVAIGQIEQIDPGQRTVAMEVILPPRSSFKPRCWP